MKSSRQFLFISPSLALLAAVGCTSIPTVDVICHHWPETKEKQTSLQMDGPEDLLVDTFHGRPRLIISSLDRRDDATLGKIFQMDLETKAITELPRAEEPDEIAKTFRPQGIDLQRVGEDTYLYTIVHGDLLKPRQHDLVVQYRLEKGELLYQKHFPDGTDNTEEEFLIQGNDVVADEANGFYATNSSGTKKRWIAYFKWLFRVHSAPTVYYNLSTHEWRRIGSLKVHGNGLLRWNDQLLIADTDDSIISELSLPNLLPEAILSNDISLPDNINRGQENDILITSHDSAIKFALHKAEIATSSGSVILAKLADGKMKTHKLFISDGTAISAPSSAVYYNGALYIGQVFDSFLLEVPVADLNKTYSCENLK